jgi:hypothetical protein
MREILFRGREIKTGKWVYGGILRYGEGAGEHSYIITGGIMPEY